MHFTFLVFGTGAVVNSCFASTGHKMKTLSDQPKPKHEVQVRKSEGETVVINQHHRASPPIDGFSKNTISLACNMSTYITYELPPYYQTITQTTK